jgi:phenylalanyl-tRNA synthetase beta subunit
MTGCGLATAWDVKDSPHFDFYDMKGRLELLLSGLRLTDISYTAGRIFTPYLHPGKAAEVKVSGQGRRRLR